MSRHIPERRRRATRFWDVFTTRARRSAPRRFGDREAPSFVIVDRHGPGAGVLVVLVLLFTLADGVLTLLLLDHSCEEANPIMAYLLERGPLWFLGGKYLLTAVGLAVFLVLKYYRLFGTRFRLGYFIPILAGLYVVLLVYQLSIFRAVRLTHQLHGRGAGGIVPLLDTGLSLSALGTLADGVVSMTWTQHGVVCLFLFVVGAAAGSFVNVCVHRLPAGLSLLRPRSRCPTCLGPIALRDNVPILGWLRLRGRCRRCRMPISFRYPLVETIVALLLPAFYLLDIARSHADPLEGDLAALMIWLFGGFLVATSFLTALLIVLDRRVGVDCSRADFPVVTQEN